MNNVYLANINLKQLIVNLIIFAIIKMDHSFVRDYDLSLDNYESNNQDIFAQMESQNDCFRINEDSKDLPNFIELEEPKKYIEQKATGQGYYEQIAHQYSFANPLQINEESISNPKQELFINSQKIKNILDVSISTICIKSKIEKGDRFQTKNLSKNLHTETAKQLKSRAFLRQFNNSEMDTIKEFCTSNKSIDSFKSLLKDQRINQRVRSFYQSKYFVHEILKSKMEMKTKIAMIKYLQKIRSLTYDKNFKAWKKDCNDF